MELKKDSDSDGDIEIKFTGLKPGEKLYEELLIGDDASPTQHKRILKAQEVSLSEAELQKYLNSLEDAVEQGDVVALKKVLKEAVSGFEPNDEVVDIVYLQKNNLN